MKVKKLYEILKEEIRAGRGHYDVWIEIDNDIVQEMTKADGVEFYNSYQDLHIVGWE